MSRIRVIRRSRALFPALITALAAYAALANAALAAENPAAPQTPGEAYVAQDYNRAIMLLKDAPDTPENRLVGALCDLYAPGRQNIPRGQQVLAKLFEDESLSVTARAEAGIALARTAQLMKQRRDYFGDKADAYDHVALYDAVIGLVPGTLTHRNAFFYRVSERLVDEKNRDAAFVEVEDFLKNFPGDKSLLPPIHMLAEYEYVRQRRDYVNGLRHLRAGYEIGYANPSENRAALFRMAFISYKRLNDVTAARKLFRSFIEVHPYSNLAPVAERFLRELGVEVDVGEAQAKEAAE